MRQAAQRVGGTTVSADTQRNGRHRQAAPQGVRNPARRRVKLAAAIAAVGAVAAIVLSLAVPDADGPVQAVPHGPQHHRSPLALSTSTGSYIGLYADGVPES